MFFGGVCRSRNVQNCSSTSQDVQCNERSCISLTLLSQKSVSFCIQVVIHVKNKFLSDSAAIHWHGIHQKGTPWMDGVAYITQCPIGPGQTFTYKFKVQYIFRALLIQISHSSTSCCSSSFLAEQGQKLLDNRKVLYTLCLYTL